MKVKFTALLITLMTVGLAGSLQAQMTFTFSDNGSGTTRITAIGSADLTGGQGTAGALLTRIGWDNFGAETNNNTTYLVSDSDSISFNEPNIGGDFLEFTNVVGDLVFAGIALESLEMNGTETSEPYPYFALKFEAPLPQAGLVSASGSSVVNFDFLGLPYFGQDITLGINNDVIFSFDAIPEPTTVSLVGLSALAGIMVKRHRTRTNKKDVIPSAGMEEKW